MATKQIKFFIIANWKTKEVKVVKKKPQQSKLTPNQIPMEFNLKVNVPEIPEIIANAEVTLSQRQVDSIVAEAI